MNTRLEKKASSVRRLRRLITPWRIALFMALLIIPGCAIYNCAARHTLTKEIKETPRDQATGVALGAEAITIFPQANPEDGAPVIRRLIDTTHKAGETAKKGIDLFNATAEVVRVTEEATLPRDPETGIIIGCETLDITPEPGSFTGDRPTTAVLLLHGFLGSRKDLADMGERLAARGFFVRIPRLPGHGTTPEDYAAQTPETMIQGVQDEYDALHADFDAVYVGGFSMGGALATLLASREDVDRLVLIAPYYGVTYMWYYGLSAESWNAMMGRFIPYVIKSDAFIKVNRAEAKKELFSYHAVPTTGVETLIRLGDEARLPTTLAAIKCPVLLVMSDGDEAASPERAHEAYDLIGSKDKTELWLDKRNNHHILWDYDREEAKTAIVNFLAN